MYISCKLIEMLSPVNLLVETNSVLGILPNSCPFFNLIVLDREIYLYDPLPTVSIVNMQSPDLIPLTIESSLLFCLHVMFLNILYVFVSSAYAARPSRVITHSCRMFTFGMIRFLSPLRILYLELARRCGLIVAEWGAGYKMLVITQSWMTFVCWCKKSGIIWIPFERARPALLVPGR